MRPRQHRRSPSKLQRGRRPRPRGGTSSRTSRPPPSRDEQARIGLPRASAAVHTRRMAMPEVPRREFLVDDRGDVLRVTWHPLQRTVVLRSGAATSAEPHSSYNPATLLASPPSWSPRWATRPPPLRPPPRPHPHCWIGFWPASGLGVRDGSSREADRSVRIPLRDTALAAAVATASAPSRSGWVKASRSSSPWAWACSPRSRSRARAFDEPHRGSGSVRGVVAGAIIICTRTRNKARSPRAQRQGPSQDRESLTCRAPG
jgi:hypothetical protein